MCFFISRKKGLLQDSLWLGTMGRSVSVPVPYSDVFSGVYPMSKIDIVDYTPKYAQAFKDLNEAWINKYFELEEEDIHTLNQPEKIIEQGGYIFVALKDR